jgi:hypothetical protein
MTDSVAPNYYDLIEIHDRQFQNFSITNGIYYVPVDEVCSFIVNLSKYQKAPMSVLLASARLPSFTVSYLTNLRLEKLLTGLKGEEDRLTAHHRILLYVFGGRLFFPPIEYPMQILECGYGQGNWAVQMAETYVQSQVGYYIFLVSICSFQWLQG